LANPRPDIVIGQAGNAPLLHLREELGAVALPIKHNGEAVQQRVGVELFDSATRLPMCPSFLRKILMRQSDLPAQLHSLRSGDLRLPGKLNDAPDLIAAWGRRIPWAKVEAPWARLDAVTGRMPADQPHEEHESQLFCAGPDGGPGGIAPCRVLLSAFY
jgi:hypothetical protein